jgi:pimeloyl-ACP methyl ester carboxylesterase
MSKFFLFCFLFAFHSLGFSATPDFQGLVELSNNQKIYAVHYKAAAGQPTVVLVNGLTYTTKAWTKMVEGLVGHDFGVLSYDARGMGKTLEASGPVKTAIPVETQADDLALLLNHFELSQAQLVGFSYGGALTTAFAAKYPERVEKLILIAPYVKPLKQQDDQLNQKVRMHRFFYPWDKRSDDEVYDLYLQQLVYTQYPIAEPMLNEHPWRTEAVFHLVQGVRKFKTLEAVTKLPAGKVHLIVAEKDQYVPKADHEELWKTLTATQKLSRTTVLGSEHKVPEAVPAFAAALVRELVTGNAVLAEGKSFVADPKTGLLKSDREQLKLEL